MFLSALCFFITLYMTESFRVTVVLFVLYRANTLLGDWENTLRASGNFLHYVSNIRGLCVMLKGDVTLTRAQIEDLSEDMLYFQQNSRNTREYRENGGRIREKLEKLGIYTYSLRD